MESHSNTLGRLVRIELIQRMSPGATGQLHTEAESDTAATRLK